MAKRGTCCILKAKSLPIFVGALTLAAGLVSPGSAPASIIAYPLTSGACCGAGPFGTVTVSTVNSTTVDVSVTLAAGEVFANTGALNHEALEFSISSNPTISVAVNTPPTSATQTFVLGSTTPVGGVYSISCLTCGGGTSNTTPGPLDFHVSVASGTLSPGSFTQDNGNFFSADIGAGCIGPGAHNSFMCANTGVVTAPIAAPAPSIGHGLSVILAVGGILFGAKLLELSKRHRSLRTAVPEAA